MKLVLPKDLEEERFELKERDALSYKYYQVISFSDIYQFKS